MLGKATLMLELLRSKQNELAEICRHRHVRRLGVFGSAATGGFNPASSDLDFLVEFEPLPPGEHAEHYFGLAEDLRRLFALPVDLVELEPIRNPYFREAVEETQVPLYVAA